MIHRLILASTSPIRSELLRRSGVPFAAMPPDFDEQTEKQRHASEPVETRSLQLAKAKALSISPADGTLVLGADQTLIFEGRLFDKPKSLSEARTQLQQFRGKTHVLQSALSMARNETIIWSHVDEARLTMRSFTDAFIEDYLSHQGESLLYSVGAYKLEERGIQLFEKIDGDYFTILGMPLLPLLHFLRGQGILAT